MITSTSARRGAAALALIVVCGSPASAQQPQAQPPAQPPPPPYVGYRLESARVLPGPASSWDYVTMDAAGRRVFLARRTAGVTVIDADTRATVGQIDEARGANGVALATDAGRGFTSNGPTNDSTMFDLATLRPLGRIAVGRSPDAIIYDPGTRRVLVSNFGDATLSLIDPAAGAVVGTIALGGTRPEGVAADGQGRAFVNLQGSDAVAVVDLRAMRLVATWPTEGCEHPTAMAYDADVRRLFVGCRGEEPVLLAMDASDGRIVATLAIGRGVDAIAIDRPNHLIVTANGVDASLSVIRQVSDSEYRSVETVGTRAMARTMALDPTNGRIFLVTSEVIRPAGEPGKTPPPFVFVPNTFTVMTYTRRAVDAD